MYTSREHSFLRRVLIAAAVGLLGASAVSASGSNSVERGGTLRVSPAASIDPVVNPDLRLLNATQLTLLAHLDQGGKRIVPEAAALPSVSGDGRTYTFTIRQGFRFSDGTPVTAANFAAAFRRLFDQSLQPSYYADLFSDVVGASEFMQGKAKTIAGVQAKGDRLVIRLLSPRPDLLVRLATPWVTAVPVDLPVVKEGVTTPFPSAGPYAVSEFTPGKSFVLVRNHYWRRDLLPWRTANVDEIVSVDVPTEERMRAVEEDRLDSYRVQQDQLPALLAKYGANKGRLFVLPGTLVHSVGFNFARPLFKNNPKLRQAVNYALDRAALAREHGTLGGRPTDQILPPGFPGFRDWKLYPLERPNLAKARALAKGNLRGGKAVMYTAVENSAYPFAPGVAQIVKRDLARMGLEVTVKSFDPATLVEKTTRRGEPWDLTYGGWLPDYRDPFGILNLLFDGQYITYDQGFLTMGTGFNNPVFNRRLRAAAELSGKARLRAYAIVDRDLMREAAPIAPYLVQNVLRLVSPSLGCFSWIPWGMDVRSGGYENWVAECKK